MTKHGAFAFMLHSHLPYVRRAGVWPHGEEMVHEAAVTEAIVRSAGTGKVERVG